MHFNISLKLIGALLLPVLMASAGPAAITSGTPSELLPTRDLVLIQTVRGFSRTLPKVQLRQSYVNDNYKGYDVVDGWYVSGEGYFSARAVTRLDGEEMRDKAVDIERKGYLLQHGMDDSSRYWIVYERYRPPHELEDEYEPAEYEKMPVKDVDSYFT